MAAKKEYREALRAANHANVPQPSSAKPRPGRDPSIPLVQAPKGLEVTQLVPTEKSDPSQWQ